MQTDPKLPPRSRSAVGGCGVTVWAPGLRAFPSCRSAPSPRRPRPAATHQAAQGQGTQFPSRGSPPPPPCRAPLLGGTGWDARAPPALAPASHGEATALPRPRRVSTKAEGLLDPPRGQGDPQGRLGAAGAAGGGSAVEGPAPSGPVQRDSDRAAWRPQAERWLRFPSPAASIASLHLLTSSACLSSRPLDTHDASKAPVFPSTLSSVAKTMLTFFNISFLEEVLWI